MNTRTVLITGGAQGIGRAITQRFLEDYATVYVADIDAEACDDLRAVCDDAKLHTTAIDVGDEQAVHEWIASAIADTGRIDVLINNVGIGAGKPIAELSLEEWDRVLRVNLTSIFLCVRDSATALKASRGSIINIASTRAFMSEPNTEAYSASKGGVVALTHSLAVSLGPHVRVNAIAPGWIEVGDWQKPSRRVEPSHSEADRSQHPCGRVGTPHDVAVLAAFLASDKAGFITGQCYPVDGGMTRRMLYV